MSEQCVAARDLSVRSVCSKRAVCAVGAARDLSVQCKSKRSPVQWVQQEETCAAWDRYYATTTACILSFSQIYPLWQ